MARPQLKGPPPRIPRGVHPLMGGAAGEILLTKCPAVRDHFDAAGTRRPPRGMEEEAEEEADAAAPQQPSARLAAPGAAVRVAVGGADGRVVASAAAGAAGGGSIRIAADTAAVLRASADSALAADAAGMWAPITDEDLWGSPSAPLPAARPAAAAGRTDDMRGRDAARGGGRYSQREQREAPLRRTSRASAAVGGTLPPVWRAPRRAEESDAADGSGQRRMGDTKRDGDWMEEEDDAWAAGRPPAPGARGGSGGRAPPSSAREFESRRRAAGTSRPAFVGGAPVAGGGGRRPARGSSGDAAAGGGAGGSWRPFAEDDE